MHRFTLWAPRSSRVEVDVDGRRLPMAPVGGGRYEAEVADAGPGTRYAFVLDGGEPLPDPRSMSQPDGVTGLSEVVDHGAFRWTDHEWRGFHLPSAVLYELHVGTFSPEGTFDGVIGRLDHLVDLGVTAVELMPVAEFPGARGWGYDGVDLYAPHHSYGGTDGLKRLVDACHANGLGVVLDVVYNHLGPAGNFLPRFGPYFTDRYTTPWGDAVNLDGQGSDEVRAFFVDNARMWLRDYHVDGLRLDAVHAIFDSSPVHFLAELADTAAAVGPPRRWLVAESETNEPVLTRPRADGGYGLDAQWHDEYHHALHAFLTGERDGYYAPFGEVADVVAALAAAVPPHRYVGFAQNHDQVGNRARGDRSSHLLSVDGLKVLAASVLLSPLVPLLFQGEEWGASTPFLYFTDHDDPGLAQAVSEGRRREFAAFGWKPEEVPDPQNPATFEASRLDWSELDKPPHAELLAWHRELLRLRRGVGGRHDPA
jgi:maltooligosyltrehalose trehalohydrolase